MRCNSKTHNHNPMWFSNVCCSLLLLLLCALKAAVTFSVSYHRHRAMQQQQQHIAFSISRLLFCSPLWVHLYDDCVVLSLWGPINCSIRDTQRTLYTVAPVRCVLKTKLYYDPNENKNIRIAVNRNSKSIWNAITCIS